MKTGAALLAEIELGRVIAWREGRAWSHEAFAPKARQLAAALPPAAEIVNLCQDRSLFMLAFVAACLRGQINLLPASDAAELAKAYPAATMLDDDRVLTLCKGAVAVETESQWTPNDLAAVVFTSGSTGDPQPHPKLWNTLAETARRSAERLFGGVFVNILATVPSQHMYGLETTAIWALTGQAALHAGRPFYPQDIAHALAEMPVPRVLVTVPVHLRALIAAGIVLPDLHSVISATAPLSPELASAAEAWLGCPVQEIYGCTEAGSVATRRLVMDTAWRLHRGLHIEALDQGALLTAPYLPAPVLLHDELLKQPDGRFELLGRHGDLLKVAGKRSSLAELTRQLLALPGVDDAVVFMPDAGVAARPAALVVAPSLSESAIRDALAPSIDAVFLPRPLRKVDSLPRSETGKLPLADLLRLLHD